MATRSRRRASATLLETPDNDSTARTTSILLSVTNKKKMSNNASGKSTAPTNNGSTPKNTTKSSSDITTVVATPTSSTDSYKTRRTAVMGLRSAGKPAPPSSPPPPKSSSSKDDAGSTSENKKKNSSSSKDSTSAEAENNDVQNGNVSTRGSTEESNTPSTANGGDGQRTKAPRQSTSAAAPVSSNNTPPALPAANSSATTLESSKTARRRESTDDSSLPSRRPKRKATSTVRFGSYKDMENVDFSLMVVDGTTKYKSSSNKVSSKKSSSTKSSKLSQKKSKNCAGARINRGNLMTSSSTAVNKTAPNKARSCGHRPPSLKNATSSQQRPARLSLKTILPPVLIERHDGKITPDMLRSLPAGTKKIDIFNRKTGRIMRGKDGIHVKDLVQVLRDHAEYEPILPCPKRFKNEHTYRESRTSPNARVSEVIQPQTMIRSSSVEGRHVIVTGGSNMGLLGKVHACIPGDWYMITDVSNPDTEYIIHSKNLKIVTKYQLSPPVSANDDEEEPHQGVKDRAEETKIAAPLKQTGDISLLPVSQAILSLRIKIKELEGQRLKLKKALDIHSADERARNDHQRAEDVKNFHGVTKALKETQSELHTKIFLDEILRSSNV